MTIAEALRAAAAKLAVAGIEEAALDARVLSCAAFGLDHAGLIARGGERADDAELGVLHAYLARRVAGEPPSRILGRREFWGLDFVLAPETLVPRADTETVVRAALDAIDGVASPQVLDLGVGSGCILLAILSEQRDAAGTGVDRSVEAAATARANAERLGLGGRARFLIGDWAGALRGRFDLIVSNPPYIATADIEGLDREVREHDPAAALDGGADGLRAYAAILADAGRILAPGGAVVLELGAGQAADVCALAASESFSAARIDSDLGGVARALTLRRRR